MQPRPAAEPLKHTWRNSKQIAGYRAQLLGEIRACRNGSTIELDLTTARAILEILDQAIHTEKGHGV